MAALPDTRMPGVITLEVPTLPPSIGVVPSAVPCFIGYTEFANKNGTDVTFKPVRIRNMREYQDYFGTAPSMEFKVDLIETVDYNEDTKVAKMLSMDVKVAEPEEFKFRMYYAMQLYYANGGGPCYIISVGSHANGVVSEGELSKGLDAAKLAKDITIITYPDACKNLNSEDYYRTLISKTLQHCTKMINRVVLVDVDDDYTDNAAITENFRSKIVKDINMKYGAAYFPFLDTTIDYLFDAGSVTIGSHEVYTASLLTDKRVIDQPTPLKDFMEALKNVAANSAAVDIPALKTEVENAAKTKSTRLPADVAAALDNAADLGAAKEGLKKAVETFETTEKGKSTALKEKKDKIKAALPANHFIAEKTTLGAVEQKDNLLYNKIKEAINAVPVTLPPSAAMSGIMVQTDATQGVWKAPANVGLAAVISPTVEIDDDFHADLNVDASSGKSVNAIRAYEGKGILVFGARTLVGNDLEWRYVSVRRTFCFIEDSIARAMQDFIFAPNTRDSWIKVKAMITNFLVEIWKAGGLFGNSMNEAFQVNVGLPETMTDVDILEGRMIVEIKLRVARPAEFIILRYEHKFQANAA